MGLPKIVVHNREIILLSGYKDKASGKAKGGGAPVTIAAKDKLRRAIESHPDAVAFGYVAGKWVAGA